LAKNSSESQQISNLKHQISEGKSILEGKETQVQNTDAQE